MGYVEGQNLAFEFRAADNREDRLAALVGDLVQRRVSVIVADGGPPIVAIKAATTSIPIIFFTGFDPVASGFVASLNRPGGNVTGITVLNTEVLGGKEDIAATRTEKSENGPEADMQRTATRSPCRRVRVAHPEC
jgi:hypothetical protein